MPITFGHERDNIYRVEISGTLGERDFSALQEAAAAEIDRTGKIRLLIVLSHFHGWAPGRWQHLTFYVKHGGDVERIAIIGDERWRTETLMFAGADVRQGSVAFFSPPYRSQAATWLDAGHA
jgi:SpoIIAA-like